MGWLGCRSQLPSRVHTAAVETNADDGASTVHAPDYPTIEQLVGNTPLVRLQRLPGKTSNVILCKLEGNNPAGAWTVDRICRQ